MRKFFVLMMLVLVVGSLVSIVFLFPRGGMTGFAVFSEGPEEGQTTLTLQEADTDNLGDAYVDSGIANKNKGLNEDLKIQKNPYQRTYIKFDISPIPANQIIDNSKLCLYLYNDQGTQMVSASHVYVHDWNEGTEDGTDVSGQDYTTNITWNNQPCGTDFDNSDNCNLTAESSISDDGTLDETWQCWSVTNVVNSEYSSGDKNVSIILYTEDLGNPDLFYSKEYTTDASLIPYLNITYHSANTAPSIILVSPQDEASFGYNEALALNFIASDVDDNINSCWYVLNSGEIVILDDCANTTIDVPEGSNTLTVYVNDTQAEQASDSATFSVQVGAPSIILHSPINSYLSSTSVTFRYTPTDLDLDSCELWGDFTGDFSLNQTDTSPTSGSENTFSLTLLDGTYIWNIRCNDTLGNSAVNGNKTFYVDTINPSFSLSQPTGTKTSRTGIPLTFEVTDASPVSCLYNIKWLTGEFVISNTSIANCIGITFNVSADGSYVLNLYVNDSAGNTNFTSSSFSIDTSSQPPSNPPSGGSSGGGGGGGGGGSSNYDIEFSGISDLVLDPGESRRMSVTAENTRNGFLNDCVIRSKGVNSEWSTSSDVQDIGPGQLQEFIFVLSLPLNINQGNYPVELALECKEFSKSFGFFVEIIEKKLEIKLLDAKREKNDEMAIYYSLIELSGNNQDVEVNIMLLGLKNEKIAEISEIKNIEAGSKNDFNTVLKIDSELKGSFNLIISVNSGLASSFIQEDIYIGNPSLVGGLAIFLDNDRSNYLINALLIIGFFIFCTLMIRRILKMRALAGLTGHKGYSKKDSRYGVIELGKEVNKASKGKKKKS